jgi:putative protease
MVKSGVRALKIEGRRRDPKYIQTTAKCYREAIDSFYAGTYTQKKVLAWIEELKSVYNRGFYTGFYFGTPGKEGISLDKADNLSKSEKIFAGFVKHYYPKINVAVVELKSAGLKVGDNIIIEGPNTFIEQKIESMEFDNKSVQKAANRSEIGLKVSGKVQKKDLVFIYNKQ